MALGGAITLVSLMTVKAMALLNSIIAARMLGPSDYGAFSVIVNLQNFAVIMACTGIPLALTKYISQWRGVDETVARDIGSTLMRVLAVSALVAGSVYLILAEHIAIGIYNDSDLVWPIRLSSAFVIVSSLNVAFTSVTQGCLRISSLAKVNAFVAIIAQPLTLASIFVLGLFGAVLAQVCATSVSVFLLWMISNKVFRLSLLRVRKRRRSSSSGMMLSFTVPAFLSSLLLVPAYWFGRTILAVHWGFDSVGEFQVAESLSQLMLMASSAMSVPLLPLISEMNAKQPEIVGASSSSLLRMMLLVVLPAGILALPFLNFMIGALYGTEYEGADVTTALMFASSAFVAMSAVMSTIIIGIGRMWMGFAMNAAWAACFFTSALVLVPLENSAGLATTYLLSYAVYFLTLLAYFNRKFGMRLGWLPVPIILFVAYLAIHISIFASQGFLVNLGLSMIAASAAIILTYKLVMQSRERRMVMSILSWISSRFMSRE